MELTDTQLTSLYRWLVLGRQLEKTMTKLPGYHPGVGEEAVIVGSFFGLREDDYIAPHYRGALVAAHMRGADLRRLIAGVLGKVTAYNRGRFRGDIYMPLQFNTLGMFSGVLGATLSIATGIALTAKVRARGDIVVTTFGEGTSNLGAFHESINLAASLSLPIVYVCQNNRYAMSTPAQQAMKCRSVADRAAGYGIPGLQVDGNDVLAVHQAVQTSVSRARAGGGPSLIDAQTYRISGHYSADPAVYQAAAEREAWQQRDPLALFRNRLLSGGLLNESSASAMDEAAATEVNSALAQAEADPPPGAEVLGLSDVFAPDNAEVATR